MSQTEQAAALVADIQKAREYILLIAKRECAQWQGQGLPACSDSMSGTGEIEDRCGLHSLAYDPGPSRWKVSLVAEHDRMVSLLVSQGEEIVKMGGLLTEARDELTAWRNYAEGDSIPARWRELTLEEYDEWIAGLSPLTVSPTPAVEAKPAEKCGTCLGTKRVPCSPDANCSKPCPDCTTAGGP